MLYYLLYQLIFREYGGASESYFFKGLNVIQYVTFRTAWSTITALLLSLFLGKWVIKRLEALKVGQEIREEGPASHHSKAGTPTMGGAAIVLASVLGAARIVSVRVEEPGAGVRAHAGARGERCRKVRVGLPVGAVDLGIAQSDVVLAVGEEPVEAADRERAGEYACLRDRQVQLPRLPRGERGRRRRGR